MQNIGIFKCTNDLRVAADSLVPDYRVRAENLRLGMCLYR